MEVNWIDRAGPALFRRQEGDRLHPASRIYADLARRARPAAGRAPRSDGATCVPRRGAREPGKLSAPAGRRRRRSPPIKKPPLRER